MIRVLAQLIARQLWMPKEGSREEADSSPPLGQRGEQIPSISHLRPRVKASPPGTQTLAADQRPDLSAQALVVLFTQLAQRHVQSVRAQEETHE